MAQGVKSDLTFAEVAHSIEKNNGVIYYVREELGISNFWLYEFFKKHPVLWDKIHNARRNYNRYKSHETCEASIAVLDKLMGLVDEHPSQALKAAMFNLENLGEDFGYGPKKDDDIGNTEDYRNVLKPYLEHITRAQTSRRSDLNIEASNISADSKS